MVDVKLKKKKILKPFHEPPKPNKLYTYVFLCISMSKMLTIEEKCHAS